MQQLDEECDETLPWRQPKPCATKRGPEVRH